MNVIAGFDIKEELAGTFINGIPVYHVSEFEERQKELNAHIGILTVPVERAQETC